MREPVVEMVLEDHEVLNLSAGGVVYVDSTRGREVALLHTHEGGLALPKGALAIRERPEDAALREVEEETGLARERLKICRYLGWYSNPLRTESGRRLYKIVIYYLIRAESRLPLKVSEEHGSAEWLSLEAARRAPFAYEHVGTVLDAAHDALESVLRGPG